MEEVLKKMQDTVSRYANVLSEILKVDVEIVDAKLDRIAGTGVFAEKVDLNISDEGYVYKKVIETGKMKVIEMPGEHEICKKCPKKNICNETFEMSTPIKINDKVIGVIGFVCFTENQKKHIFENYDTFIEFLNQISELIASKAFEIIKNYEKLAIFDLLNVIIDKIEQGVIVFDKKQAIAKTNFIAREMLKLDSHVSEIKTINLEPTGNQILNLMEYRVEINDLDYYLIGTVYDVNIGNFNKMFIFKDADLIKENVLALTSSNENIGLDKIFGQSRKISNLKNKVKMIASATSTVLINGESGTGKELFARALHEESDRANAPFVAINCGAIPENLLESELFGYVKGAFTGADPKGKLGKFELADKGTLFLDEIGDMPLYIQVKLLRVLEQREIVRLGSNKPIKVNVRVIAATNKNLEEMIKDNTFREDLYYRLNVIPLNIPSLKEREEDIRLIATRFINKFSKLFDKKVVKIEDEFWNHIENYAWPGNVRELQNTIEYVINMLKYPGIIKYELLPEKIKNVSVSSEIEDLNLDRMEKRIIKKALDIYGNDADSKKIIAQKLGIGIATLYRKLKKYNL
ncbi:sigma 54-interacting transcriptional regulator [Clostridium aestuarii]|uniref:Sigma 54-interacting transcriptional regulator n=1 Tax=Clostridium aestuarii TaxID=338193 RepID=A0ABT4CVN1_9CLOT|nr:sigma 54-interacting transcriptional regulator [Clostridium aestuarii]MCY6483044.1 sigma 54-interacting transcriptional regulator [Clostridium aestuarii]